MVPSANTLLTAPCPHAFTIAGPVSRAAGKVTFPCADTVATSSAVETAIGASIFKILTPSILNIGVQRKSMGKMPPLTVDLNE
jgi:hypothetical protein